jgi:hypothetical protein
MRVCAPSALPFGTRTRMVIGPLSSVVVGVGVAASHPRIEQRVLRQLVALRVLQPAKYHTAATRKIKADNQQNDNDSGLCLLP